MTEFQRLYTGRLWSVMAWDQLTTLWQRIDPAPPAWIMSRLPPDGILAARPAPANRRRWWQGLLADS